MKKLIFIFAAMVLLSGCKENDSAESECIDGGVHVPGKWISPFRPVRELGGPRTEQWQECVNCGRILKREYH